MPENDSKGIRTLAFIVNGIREYSNVFLAKVNQYIVKSERRDGQRRKKFSADFSSPFLGFARVYNDLLGCQ